MSQEDRVAARGMRMLSAPLKGDRQVLSGESGAAAFGALAAVMRGEVYAGLRKQLSLGESARVLCFSTEGDTDPERWRNIVWEARER